MSLLLLINNLSAQNLILQTAIPSPLQESSGLLYLNGKLITHTDSGGEPALYEMDTMNGTQTRKVVIQNATNIDWEDIAMDKDYIYIGDFGNNQGSRTNLRIYRVLKQEYLTKDTIQADTIQFNYSDQTNFTPTSFSTNFDAEAMISLGDSLYIFTKNWGDSKTNIYPISKQPGQYALTKTDSINSQGWITGAVCDSAQQQILLIGYTFNTAFYIRINVWTSTFSTGSLTRAIIQPNSSIQIEGVTQIDSVHYFISSEKFQSTLSELHIFDYRLPISVHAIDSRKPIEIYPNPAVDYIYIKSTEDLIVDIYSSIGRLLLHSDKKKIDIQELPSGSYFVRLHNKHITYYQKLIIQ